MSYERECEVALRAAREAAALVARVYATDFGVEWKGRGDPITEADRQANELLVCALREAFPGDAVCAEEARAEDAAREAAKGGRCWFVDPLDGTQEFVNKNGEFCVMVGLAVDGRATLGVLVAPAWRRTFVGVVGDGAYELLPDGARRSLAVGEASDPASARMVVSRSHQNPTVAAVARDLGITQARPCGSVGLKVALVATGEAELYVHLGRGPKLWDGCAPEAVARAAGAAVTDARGRALGYHTDRLPLDEGLVVAPPALAARAIRALAATLGA